MDNHLRIKKVSRSQLFAFNPADPSTSTGVQLVDVVMTAFLGMETPQPGEVAKMLHEDLKKLTVAMELYTGMKPSDIALELRLLRLRQVLLQNLDKSMDEIANLAGYYDRSGIERYIRSKRFAHIFGDINLKTLRPKRYYK